MLINRKKRTKAKKKAGDRLQKLLENEERMSKASKEALELTSSLSNFSLEIKHFSDDSLAAVKQMEEISASNLSVIQETTATANVVKSTIEAAAADFEALTKESQVLSQKNEESREMLESVAELKENVVSSTNDMNEKIEQLILLTNEIDNMVQSVQSIANQTNLLALNAAIEAARAGDTGRGFAVVSEEIRTLSDSTKQNLEGMKTFMQRIYEAADAGKESVSHAIRSTAEMGERIDAVSDTIVNNIAGLKKVTGEIENLSEEIDNIKLSATEINHAMDASAKDAENLTHAVLTASSGTEKTLATVRGINALDDGFDKMMRGMFIGLLSGDHALTNDELLALVKKAKVAHTAWLGKLKKMVDTMTVTPLQTDSNKCAFGHFYSVMNIKHPVLAAEWKNIDRLHQNFHQTGNKGIAAILKKDEVTAGKAYAEAESISKQMLGLLDTIEIKIIDCTKQEIRIFE